MKSFDKSRLKNLFTPEEESEGEDNGQVTIIGGSELFHGAPLLSLKVASRVVDMVFFATPEKSVGKVAEKIKSQLFSFVWVPWEEVQEYIKKSDTALIGPGFMRFKSEKMPPEKRNHKYDEAARKSRDITKRLLEKFPDKRWVIDAGSLQVMEPEWIPEDAILTPNKKEYELLFESKSPSRVSAEYKCTIVLKGPVARVCSKGKCVEIENGNPGLTKGGTGDVLAGLTVSLLAKNDPFLAASSASFVVKSAADKLFEEVGVNYNADDLADRVPQALKELTN